MKNVKPLEKKTQRLLKVVKETVRDLDPDRLSDVAGGYKTSLSKVPVPG